jgi:hypothetical protein
MAVGDVAQQVANMADGGWQVVGVRTEARKSRIPSSSTAGVTSPLANSALGSEANRTPSP